MLKKKSIISLLLALAMIFTMLAPMAVFAEEPDEFIVDIEEPVAEEVDEPIFDIEEPVAEEVIEPIEEPVAEEVFAAISSADFGLGVLSLDVTPPVPDVVTPAAQEWRTPSFAGDPSGFRPDQVPASVTLSKQDDAVIFYTKAVVPMPTVTTYGFEHRAFAPTQEQIDAVAAPTGQMHELYFGPISLAEIDYNNAVVIKAVSYTTNPVPATSTIATFVYYQRTWVLTDVFTDGEGNPNDNSQKVPTEWTNFILDEVVNEMTQGELALMTGGSVNGQVANEVEHPYGAYTTGTINSVSNQYGRSDVRMTSATIGTDFGLARLTVPTTVMTDGPAGVRNGRSYSTAWVVATALASAWDPEVQYMFGSSIANEAAYFGFDMMLAPAMNIHRSPLGGRNFEYYSEDPYITYMNGLTYTNALLEKKVGVSLKHFMANDQENNRNNLSSTVSERTLREVMGYPFMRISEESDPYALMSIYGIVNQVRASDHRWMIDQLPREQWNFQGYVQTDWGNHWDAHSMAARLNQHQPTNNYTNGNQFVNFENGRDGEASSPETKDIRLALLRRNSRDILVAKIKMPVFNGLYNGLNATETQNRQANFYTRDDSPYAYSAAMNRSLAARAQILLKNEVVNGAPVLPLVGANKQKISLIYSGIMARCNVNTLQHNTDYIVQGGGSGQVSWGKDALRSPTAAQALGYAGYDVVNYVMDASMFNLSGNANGPYTASVSEEQQLVMDANAATYAASSDVGIYIISRPSGEGSDPNVSNFNIHAGESAMLKTLYEAFKAVGKPFVVITNLGGNINTTEIRQYSDAILHMSAAGETGGYALADVLSGAVNPSGKTVDSWPLSFADAVPNLSANFFADKIDPSLTGYVWANTSSYVTGVYTEDVLTGYKFFETAEALDPDFKVEDHLAFPFGYGLSYTTFSFTNLRLDKEFVTKANDDTVTATVTVTNTGTVPGRTTAQLYISASTWKEEGRPIRDLRNYDATKVLAPGESEDITFVIEKRDLCYFDDGSQMDDNFGTTWKPWKLKMSGTSANATVVTASDPKFAAYANVQATGYTTAGVYIDYSNASQVNANLTRGVSEELNQFGYTDYFRFKDGVEGYTTYNGFYGDNGHKTGWRIDAGTVITVQIGDSSRTPDLAERGVEASFTYGEYGSIAAPEIWNSDDETFLGYDISVGRVDGVNIIDRKSVV